MVLISILLAFSVLGMADKLMNGRLGLAKSFDQGLASMGPLCVSIAGIYCGVIWLMERSAGFVAWLQQLPFDASLLIGAVIAPDLGGWPMCETVAQSVEMGYFSGILVSSTLGGLLSFALPISFGLIKREDRPVFTEGVLWGMAATPLGLLPGGLILGMDVRSLAAGIIPMALFCGLLILGLRVCPEKLMKILTFFGNAVSFLGMALFGLMVFGFFMPDRSVFSTELAGEAMQIIVKTTAIICGSLVLSTLASKYMGGFFSRAAEKMGVNLQSVLGLVLTLVTSISMLPLYENMDDRGKKMNAAFVVSGAFCLGGQMAYVATVSNSQVLAAYMVSKLTGGVLAVLLAGIFCKSRENALKKPM